MPARLNASAMLSYTMVTTPATAMGRMIMVCTTGLVEACPRACAHVHPRNRQHEEHGGDQMEKEPTGDQQLVGGGGRTPDWLEGITQAGKALCARWLLGRQLDEPGTLSARTALTPNNAR